MTTPRVMVSFVHARIDTTGSYVLGALIDLLGRDAVTFIDPVQFDLVFDDAYDLFLAIDDDGEWTFPDAWQPCAAWLLDTHMDFPKRLRRAGAFNYTFAAQWDGACQFQRDGIDAEWLPLACYPAIHQPVTTEKRYQWSFVGHLTRSEWLPPERMNLADQLKIAFPDYFAGEAYFEDMMEKYSAAAIVWNRSIKDDINMRVFEGLASGSFLLTNRVPMLETLVTPMTHCGFYDDAECLDQLRFWLTHPVERQQIARQGLTWVRQRHTYQHRAARILERCLGWIVPETSRSLLLPQPRADGVVRQPEGVPP